MSSSYACGGDEFSNGWETLDGFSVVTNPSTGYWEYAKPDASGNLAPSGVVAAKGSPPVPAHLRPTEAAVEKARGAFGAPAAGAPPAPAPPAWAHGTINTLVIMVQFPSGGGQAAVPCTYTAAQMQANLFGVGASGPGNLHDYYNEVSYGNLLLSPGPADVVGCFTVTHNKNYYDDGPGSAPGLVAEAMARADPNVDSTPYDNDHDGAVDNVAIVYAGCGPDDGCYYGTNSNVNNLWPHAWQITPVSVDHGPRTVSEYYMVPEMLWKSPDITRTIGVFAHEFGHKLGLPDLYDTDGSSEGVGHWSVMGSGSWTSNTPGTENGESPAHMDAWSKWFLHWITPAHLSGPSVGQSIPQAETSPFAVQLERNPAGPDDWTWLGTGIGEYFLVENRQQTGFDQGLDGCGLLIWHIEESQGTNSREGHTTASHRLMDLEEAHPPPEDLDSHGNRGDAGDPYRGSSGNTTFDDTSTPDSKLYSGAASGVSVSNISAGCTQTMTADLSGTGGVGGIAELPALAAASAEEAGAPAGGSGWSERGYATLTGTLAAGAIVIAGGGWYARRRRLK